MPPKPRSHHNRGYPKGWRLKHGAFRYRVPPGLEHLWDGKREFTLGRTEAEAYRTWADRLELHREARTVGELLDRYAQQIVPTKAPATRRGNLDALRHLRPVFGHMPIAAVKPAHAYRYIDLRSQQGRTAARREFEVLRHALTKAVEWGLIETNPLLGQVRVERPPGRDRYVEDWEVIEALTLPPRRKHGSVAMLQAYIRLKLLTGLRRTDLLRLRTSDLQDDGIHVTPSKTSRTTGARRIFEWDDALRQVIQQALAARPLDIGPWLFCNRRGEPYQREDGRANGFDSIWQRFMARLLAETKTVDRWVERDLRAKAGTDAGDLERARRVLALADSRTALRWYRRKPEKVKPLRGL